MSIDFGNIIHAAFNPLWGIAEAVKNDSKVDSLQQENDDLKRQVQGQLDDLTSGNTSTSSTAKTTSNSASSLSTTNNSTILIGGAVIMLLLIVLIFLKRK